MAEPGTPLPLFSFPGPEITSWNCTVPSGSADSASVEAEKLTERISMLDQVYRTGYIERGLICRRMDSQALWRYILDPDTKAPCHSFNAWLLAYAPWSRADCYAAMKTVQQLSDIPTAKLVEIPRCNLKHLEGLSTGMRSDPEVLRIASTASENGFLSYLGTHHPTQHIEPRKRLRTLPASLLLLLEEAVSLAIQRENLSSWEQGLEVILADYLSSSASSDS